MEKVTICINTSDRPRALSILLNSLWLQSRRDFDIIIVDDGEKNKWSKADLAFYRSKFERFDIKIRYIKNPSRFGLALSRNVGLDLMNTKVGVFLDDDHICDSRFMEFLLCVFDREENVGCVGALFPHVEGVILHKEDPPKVFGDLLNDKGWGDHQRFYYPFYSNKTGIYPAIALGGIVAFRKDQRIRKEDTLSVVSHTEDTLFSLRYIQHGYKNFVNTRAIAYHRVTGHGGCRTFPDAHEMRLHDSTIFRKILSTELMPVLKDLKL